MIEEHEKWNDRRKLAKRVHRMTKAEILNLFETYGFTDSDGHPLRNCVDFRALVEMATEGKKNE